MSAINRGFLGFPKPKLSFFEPLAVKVARGAVVDLQFGRADFDWTAYEEIEFRFVNLLPATAGGVYWQAQISQDGGATFSSSANYGSLITKSIASPAVAAFTSTTTAWNLIGDPATTLTAQSNQLNYGLNGKLVATRPWETFNKMWHAPGISYFDANAVTAFCTFAGAFTANGNPISGIRFFYNTGNIAQGAIYAFGFRRAANL